ncbi:thymidine phosphorylase family protein [Parahaliea mediterranea]|uniref:thymidine phosphorylase family protein n=1 Tax=Parahaliea mediterranea TaxID=651086 RepID=UPI000C097E9B|nr:thymidine phosphorylase family protein [Parahaliea mediterranea]MAC33763.1 thymidine phosphorylase [Haliea sp.]
METLKVIDIGINTHQEPVIYMRSDCLVCRAEGFVASTRVSVNHNGNTTIATLNVVDDSVLAHGEAGLSKVALSRLDVAPGQTIRVTHAPVVRSVASVRKKTFGHKLSGDELAAIIEDINAHRYSDIEIASFLSVCAGNRLDIDEIIGLTNAMVACGQVLSWPGHDMVLDKHCIGGLPGNRTTPLVVSVVSAAGFLMPKTSSRAITSPAGTADTMETLMDVDLALPAIRRVVAHAGACLAWGGAVNLSPADDLLIRIERALDLDGEGQMVASVLSKKIAAGATHAIVDIPVGETAKTRTLKDAERLSSLFTQVGAECGIHILCVISDGLQPVGRGIGPAEEARDVLAVLRNETDAPQDLRERALFLSAKLLMLARNCALETAHEEARTLLDNGSAWQQFQRIATAQGGLKTLPEARFQHEEYAGKRGIIARIDNRQLSRLAKLAGAPFSPAAGLRLHVQLGSQVEPTSPLFTLFADSGGERDYALDYYRHQAAIFSIEESL